MKAIADFGRYLWRFFIGDSYQAVALVVAFAVIALLARSLRAWDGLLAFVLVAAVMGSDIAQRYARQSRQARQKRKGGQLPG